jgi:hypothetical protein
MCVLHSENAFIAVYIFLNLTGGLAGNITVSILLASDAANAAVNYVHLYTQAAIEVPTPVHV